MTHYWLYLESSPGTKTTMVHVLDLLGCICRRPSPEAALAATPDAIRAYLRFLRLHGEFVPGSDSSIKVQVAEHVTEGEALGDGSASCLFQAERAQLDKAELEKYLAWLDWSHQDLVGLVEALTAEQLEAQAKAKDRSLREILEHVWKAERWFVDKVAAFPPLPEDQDTLTRVTWVHMAAIDTLRALSSKARDRVVYRPDDTGDPWNVRKVLRRMLEHRWEHSLEIRSRLVE